MRNRFLRLASERPGEPHAGIVDEHFDIEAMRAELGGDAIDRFRVGDVHGDGYCGDGVVGGD